MATAIRDTQQQVIGVISIAGPNVRLTPERMASLSAALLEAAEEMAATSLVSIPKLSLMTSPMTELAD